MKVARGDHPASIQLLTWTGGIASGFIPAWNFLLGNGIVADTGNAGLGAARATGELLIAAILAEATTIAGAHVAEVAALPRLDGMRVGGSGARIRKGIGEMVVWTRLAVAVGVAVARGRIVIVGGLTLSLGRLLDRGRRPT